MATEVNLGHIISLPKNFDIRTKKVKNQHQNYLGQILYQNLTQLLNLTNGGEKTHFAWHCLKCIQIHPKVKYNSNPKSMIENNCTYKNY